MKMSSDLSNSLYERLQDYATNNDKDALAQSLSESFGIPPLRAAQMAELPFDRILEKLEHIITLMKRSIKEQCEAKRAHFQTEYQPVFDMLLPHMKAFLAKHADSEPSNFSALDIGSGYAIGTVTMALTLQAAFPKSKLLWYPSDWDGSYNDGGTVEKETRKMLQYLVQESQEFSVPLFIDKKKQPIFQGNAIELCGLKAVQFNGKPGYILGPDANAQGRFAIQLSLDPKDCKSFKQENITYLGDTTMHDAMLRHLRIEHKDEEFFQGLLERTRMLDILKHETWSNVEDLRNRCALVTCTSLLTCLGYRDPSAWQDTMQLAAELLRVDGYLLQYDAIGYADFGDDDVMQSFANDKSLGLELIASSIKGTHTNIGSERKVMIWQKL